MKRFDPVMAKFRDTFYDGNKEDPECAEKPKATGKGRGRGGYKSN
jgi:hypothetical protein